MVTKHDATIYEERTACPLYTAIGVIDGRWKPMIFQRLSAAPLGFGELRRAMPRITTKVLREQLRQMMADDLVAREELTPRRLGTRYRVTPYGRSLGPVFNALWSWGRRHLQRQNAARGTMVVPPFEASSLLVPERDDRIDARGSASRQPASRQRRSGED
jgi:DNA-binding HxlR family transcriptional regulator